MPAAKTPANRADRRRTARGKPETVPPPPALRAVDPESADPAVELDEEDDDLLADIPETSDAIDAMEIIGGLEAQIGALTRQQHLDQALVRRLRAERDLLRAALRKERKEKKAREAR